MIELTESQYSILEQLDGNQRVCVLGGAGTGKTLLAMEQARRLAAQGHRVLLTCFNAPLGGHIRAEMGKAGVDVLHFHLLCRTWAELAGLDPERHEGEADQDYWDVRLPNLLTEAAAELDKRYDAILIDEAQDLQPDWLAALQLLLADEEQGVMFLFADENQAIYQRAFEVPRGFMRFTLKDNLRNAAPIHGLLSRHFGETSRAKGPDGVEVQVRCHGDTADLRQELSSLLSHLTAHGVTTDQITVLSGKSAATSVLARHAEEPLGSFRLVGKPSRAGHIRFESVHRFKGLEAPVVVLCEMGDLRPEVRRKLWYTGLSRARVALFVLARAEPGEDLDAVISQAIAEPA
jgi:superfamily I DNA/RNA helicase